MSMNKRHTIRMRLKTNPATYFLYCLIATVSYAVQAKELASQVPDAVVKINLRSNLGSVNRLIFGNNSLGYLYGPAEYSAKGAGVWNPLLRAPEPEMVQLARDAGVRSLRWPGGCGAHEFNWKLSVGPVETRPNQPFGLAEFLLTAEEIGASPVITIADYWGEANDAADLVEYLNTPIGVNPNNGIAWAAVRARQGHPKPYGVVWFEYGNETHHGPHVRGTIPNSSNALSPSDYARRFKAAVAAMKEVDPNVRVGAVLASETSFPLSPWTETVLRETAREADFYIYHAYLPVLTENSGGASPDELLTLAFAGNEQFANHFRQLKAEIYRITGRDIPLAVTEFNGYYVQERPKPYRFTIGTAVQVADLILKLLQPAANVKLANYWHMSNEYWGMIRGYGPPYVKRPAYHMYRLFNEHIGERLLSTDTTAGFFRTKGGYGVLRSGKVSDNHSLSATRTNGLSWKISYSPGASAAVDAKGILRVTLDDENINYYQARIPMPIVPGLGYRVTAELRANGFVNSGARLEVIDDRGWVATKSSSLSPPVKASAWTNVAVDYIPLADARGIEIRARRLNAREKGQFEIRNVQVQTFQPDFIQQVAYLAAVATSDVEKVTLFVVNRNVRERTRVRIEGLPSGHIQAWTLTGAAIDATNEYQENINIEPLEFSLTPDKTAVFVSLPPHSFSVVRAKKIE